jgi:predicted nucleic acid-binding protein
MAQVIDASIAVAWCIPTQTTPLSDSVLTAAHATGGHVPAQFWFEVIHSIERARRRGLVTQAAVDEFLLDLADLPLNIDSAHTAGGMIILRKLAHQHRLNVYDASYLELSMRLRMPLATQDASLARAAKSTGTELFKV